MFRSHCVRRVKGTDRAALPRYVSSRSSDQHRTYRRSSAGLPCMSPLPQPTRSQSGRSPIKKEPCSPGLTISLPTTAMSSVFPFVNDSRETLVAQEAPPDYAPASPDKSEKITRKPAIKWLFCLSSRRELITYILPAIALGVFCGLLPVFIAIVLGRAFEIFANFVGVQVSTSEPAVLEAAKHTLLHDMLIVMVILLLTGLVTFVANVAASTLWACFGESVSKHLRQHLYQTISKKPLAWFDTGGDAAVTGENGNVAGGLTGRFARETDDVRLASGQVIGHLCQYICTFMACLVLALVTSAKLTLVIICGLPLIVIVVLGTERYTAPLVVKDRDLTAEAAGRIERAIDAIPTVKAFNAEKLEIEAFRLLARQVERAYSTLSAIYGLRLAFADFIALAMFVQGFWYGAELVAQGSVTAGQVTRVFWATMYSASHVQHMMPLLVQFERGRIGMAGLLDLCDDGLSSSHQTLRCRWSSTSSTLSPKRSKLKPGIARPLRKIIPYTSAGGIQFSHVTFHYPARPYPAAPALKDVSLFIPAGETTFIVGASGSGKSTISALLMGLYTHDFGQIEIDEQAVDFIDPDWLRSQIGVICQGAAVVFEATVHDNVAMGVVGQRRGRSAKDVTRAEVIQACKAAHLHDFVEGLPDGYESILSADSGTNLSGGQRQRLAIARAFVRAPTILVLGASLRLHVRATIFIENSTDEAVSALDVTSRVRIYESVKTWRRGKTSIVITHDLSPIVRDDFIYVLQDGRVAEHGYRYQLEAQHQSAFSRMLRTQHPPDLSLADRRASAWGVARQALESTPQRRSLFGALMLPATPVGDHPLQFDPPHSLPPRESVIGRQPGDTDILDLLPAASSVDVNLQKRLPPLPTIDLPASRSSSSLFLPLRQPSTDHATDLAQLAGDVARESRRRALELKRSVTSDAEDLEDLWSMDLPYSAHDRAAARGYLYLVLALWPYVDKRKRMFVGFACCMTMGASIPLFSYFVAQLLSALTPQSGVNLVRTSLIVLVFALGDSLSQGARYCLLQQVAMSWITNMRELALSRSLIQDKAWFDKPQNSPVTLTNIIVKDAEDARNIIGLVAGQILTCSVMISTGLIWAMIVGWELTLTGLAVVPAGIGASIWTGRKVRKYEAINKALREKAAESFHEIVAHVRAIRSMSLEPVFHQEFEARLDANHRMQLKAAPLAGLSYAVAGTIPCVIEALMLYVGAVLMADGRYTFARMTATISLMVLSVSFSAQLLSYGVSQGILRTYFFKLSLVPTVSKAVQAAVDLSRLLTLPTDPSEARGTAKLPVTGRVAFKNVTFSYPTRPNHTLLSNLSFELSTGECVGLVGSSGSGKSTVAALLQRLYEPSDGVITLDNLPLTLLDVHHLRDHLAVVSQHPALLGTSIKDNIAYALSSEADIDKLVEQAARRAHVHEWIAQLPQGYGTPLGDNTNLVSGGQAQRLQIARALVKERQVLILDECTSALDAANAQAVMQTFQSIKKGKTTLVITHKFDMMKMCDRLIVLEDGHIAETGTFDELNARRYGAFARLAKVGVWDQ